MTRKFETYDDYRRHLKNKYGQGEGINYKPWFTVRDVKDKKAFRALVFGLKTGREHHLLSSIEAQLFYLLDFRDDVIDIREQFPLIPLEVSQKIANTLGIEHPTVVKTGIPHLMTTDILATVKIGSEISHIAYCVKPEKMLEDQRILEKIEIERIWWEQLGVPFKLFTGNKKTEIQSRNISWATDPLRSNTQYDLSNCIEQAISLLSIGKHIKSDICNRFIEAFALENSQALNLLRILIAKKLISVDMSNLLEETLTITINDITPYISRVSGEY